MGAVETQPDERAVQPPAPDDRRFLAELYDDHAAHMLGVAQRMLGSRADAEDLVHDVFVEAWRDARAYDDARGTQRAWLMVRLRTRAIDRLRNLQLARRKGMEHAREQDHAPRSGSPVDAPDARRARVAVAGLSEGQRTVIELGYFEGLTCREIAERCDLPLGTVKSRLSAALSRLRRDFIEPVAREEISR